MEHSAGLEQQSYRCGKKAASGLPQWGFALVLLLAGCAHPVRNADAPAPNSYIVQRDDTLYSIAFRNELDYRQLAAWNGIHPPYRIHPGQSLSLRIPALRISSPPSPARSTAASVTVKSGDSLFAIAQRLGVSTLDLARRNHLVSPYRIYPGRRLSVPPRPSQANPAPVPVPRAVVVIPDGTNNPLSWIWPASGKIVSSYDPDSAGRHGIGIAGHAGQPKLAASSGIVVYIGDGLIGYGRLIIIQHANGYLSAYGYNRSLLVKESQRVRAGQTIAEMGDTGSGHPLLHFEIRHDGKPVNPLQYLPSIQPVIRS
jgi:lipoprotein NlpD